MIEPLEKTDPGLAAWFVAIANRAIKTRIKIFGTRVFKKVRLDEWREINLDLGRNDLCFCGSGKKHKKCCLREEV